MPERCFGPGEQALQAEVARLNKIVRALMDRAERSASVQGSDFSLFQTAVMLEERVRSRTAELEIALRENERINRALRVLQEELRELSTHDPLTGLYNRRYLEVALGQELIAARRHGHPVSVIMGDLDHFKEVNDRYGHLAGDAVLRAFGERVKQHARGSDIYCRYGGEEFLLVLPQMALGPALERAEQLRDAVASASVPVVAERIAVTASFGVATFADVDGGEELIAAADRALYAAKAAGRNCVRSSTCHAAPHAVEIPNRCPHSEGGTGV